jgi:nucleotide-binding universal stress UspA family protein
LFYVFSTHGGIEMIPEIKKILYATDLSKNARYAFGYAASLANRYGAGITLLHTLEDSPSSNSLVVNIIGAEKWNELREKSEEKVIETIKERLEKFCADVSAELPTCPFITDEIIVKAGNPTEEVLHQANTKDFDMVVMGCHGAGALANAMLGSTSRRVLRRCKKPVLIVRLPEGDEA